jgi:hypothetical protein
MHRPPAPTAASPSTSLAAHALAAMVFAALAAGCGGVSSPAAPEISTVSIASISPAAGTTLAPGATVTITATLNFLSSASTATLVVVITDQANRVLNSADQFTTIVPGTAGSVKFTLPALKVPAAGVSQIQVQFDMTPNQAAISPPAMAVATYPVAAGGG